MGSITKNSSTRDWLIDSVVIVGLAGVAVYLLPLVAALFAALSLRLGRTLFWVQSVTLVHLLPHIIIGSLLGLVTGWFIRHRKLSLASLPSVLLCAFYAFYLSFGSGPYPWGQSWFDVVIISSWLLLIAASLICARFILRRRETSGSFRFLAGALAVLALFIGIPVSIYMAVVDSWSNCLLAFCCLVVGIGFAGVARTGHWLVLRRKHGKHNA